MNRQTEREDLGFVLALRECFVEADCQLGEALQDIGRIATDREECLLALVAQQRAYDAYVGAILALLGRLADMPIVAAGQSSDTSETLPEARSHGE